MNEGEVVTETFRKHWFFDHVTSSLGYVVTLRRDRLIVRDPAGEVVEFGVEWAPSKKPVVHVFASAASGMSDAPSGELHGRIERAFDAAGWTLRLHIDD